MKTCSRCKTDKELKEFAIRLSKKDGLDCYCKICRSEYYKSRCYDRKIYNKTYSRKDKEKRSAYLKEYRKHHKYAKKNKDKEADRIRKMVKRALMYTQQSKLKSSKELLGWSRDEFIGRLGEIPIGYHIDHKIPISWFIKETPVCIINHLENLHYLKKDVNLKKRNSYCDLISAEYFGLCKDFIKRQYLERVSS